MAKDRRIHVHKALRFSKRQLLIFALIFGLIGGYFIWKSFAAPNPNLTSDLNNDNTVNVLDLSILLSNYSTTASAADINNDGTVNILDLSILLSNYGNTVAPSSTKMIGINGTYSDTNYDYLQDAQNLGVQWMRDDQWGDDTGYEPVCQNATQISQATCGVPLLANNMAAHNIHIFPLVNNYDTSWVTANGKQQWVDAIVHTATTYAKGGTFWQGKTDYGSPVIEVGNEVYGQWYNWPDQGWLHPGDYALMVKQAAIAVNSATNGRIKLLASVITDYFDTLDTNGGSDGTWHHWDQDMKATVPDIENYIGGVVSHPYGDIAAIGVCLNSPCSADPNWSYQQLYTVHSQWNVPVYVTEVGQKAASNTAGNGQVGYANQTAAMNYYFNDLKNNSWEAGMFWYNQKDYQVYDSNADNGWALIDSTGYRKPAWNAYQTQATNFPN